MGLKLTFFGTPETALPFLKMLWEKKAVVSVVTQPDKPAHRGQIVQKSAVKSFVEEKGLPVFQPMDLRDPAWIRRLSETKPEAAVVVAYGRLIPKEVLEIFPLGLYNVHFSLLPALRGAAPIQWAIWRGESKTGVSIFKISETLDTGNILCQSEIPISKQDDAFTLEEKLVLSALQTLKNALSLIEEGQTQGRPQTGNP
ncbi:MAG: methionyl-tRNA formyltransferase, partial [Elusimicrobia bacterium]|nr:methionyl-tRNA formyltransferase [Elusimicrobiota bacterium]